MPSALSLGTAFYISTILCAGNGILCYLFASLSAPLHFLSKYPDPANSDDPSLNSNINVSYSLIVHNYPNHISLLPQVLELYCASQICIKI